MANAIFVSIGGVLLLREPSVPGRWMAVLAGFAGTVIVVQPDIEGMSLGALAVVLSAVGYAATQIHAKIMTRTEPIPHVIARRWSSRHRFPVRDHLFLELANLGTVVLAGDARCPRPPATPP